MGQALYRKYRSKNFQDVVGQNHITDTLARAVPSGRISHAYLFTGPRGVGKTSVARILAHQVNDLPYDEESTSLDIIEIDAASNNGVEDVRELRDKAHTSPTSAKYKVYIIDEVHMLSKPAFNALLKTLEEPPPHVIFILATTEAHKLPETIISRTQRFEFKPVTAELVAKRLAHIAKAEKIKIDKSALELLAEHGEGSFRDSISLLDQLASGGQAIDADTVRRILGVPSAALIEEVLAAVRSAQPADILKGLAAMRAQGVSAASAAKAIASRLRQFLAEGDSASWLTPLLKDLVEVPASRQPEVSLEIALLEATLGNLAPRPSESTPPPGIKVSTSTTASPAVKNVTRKPSAPRSLDTSSWEEILEVVKKRAASLYTALRLAEPTLEGNVVTLSFQFPLHQKKLEQSKNKDLVAKTVSEVLGKKISIGTVVTAIKTDEGPAKVPLQTISNIFGASEVLES